MSFIPNFGGENFEEFSPAQITSSQNNYGPSGWTTSTHVRLDSDAAYNITGFDATVLVKTKILVNVGSFNITLLDSSSSSDAANRITISGGDLIVEPNDSVSIYYDSTSTIWRVV